MALVSFVLNNRLEADGKPKYRVGEATRERILDVAERLGYEPAGKGRPMVRGESRVVAVLLQDPEKDAALARETERLLYRQGYTVLLGYTWGDPERHARLLRLAEEQKVEKVVDLVLPPPDVGTSRGEE